MDSLRIFGGVQILSSVVRLETHYFFALLASLLPFAYIVFPRQRLLDAGCALGVGVVCVYFFTQAEREPDGSMAADGFFIRAYDKANGAVLWERRLEQAPHGVPMTYMHEGRQFIAFSTGGRYEGGELLAFVLPE